MKVRDDRVFWQRVGDEIVLLDLNRSVYYRLNGSAAHLWEQLQDGSNEAEMVDSLIGRYDVDRAHSLKDVRRFISSLNERDLLEE